MVPVGVRAAAGAAAHAQRQGRPRRAAGAGQRRRRARVRRSSRRATTSRLHLVKIWEDLLQLRTIGVRDNFFDLGGHSLLAVQLMNRIDVTFHRRLPLDILWFRDGTIEALAQRIPRRVPVRGRSGAGPDQDRLAPAAVRDVHHRRPPVLLLRARAPPRRRAGRLWTAGARRFRAGTPDHTIEAIAAHCIESMRTVQPTGPYLVAGYSAGGVVAFEVAQQLAAAGQQVALLALLDTYAPQATTAQPWRQRAGPAAARQAESAADSGIRLLCGVAFAEAGPAAPVAHRRARRTAGRTGATGRGLYTASDRVLHRRGVRGRAGADNLGWVRWSNDAIRIHRLPGGHSDLVKPPVVEELAARLQACIDLADCRRPGRGQECPPLDPTQVHVWTASLRAAGGDLTDLCVELAPDERARADRFRTPQLRRRFVVARVILRRFSRRMRRDPSAGSALATAPTASRVSWTRRICASTSRTPETRPSMPSRRGGEVGIDIEATAREVDVVGVARQAFSSRECEALVALAPDAQREAFFRIWTRKEAYIKARGEGLSYPTRLFSVSHGDDDDALIDDERDGQARDRWRVSGLDAPPGFAAALARPKAGTGRYCASTRLCCRASCGASSTVANAAMPSPCPQTRGARSSSPSR